MSIKDTARWLRKNMTPEEKILWRYLRNRRLGGYKFRRQYPVDRSYIVDFYCHEKKLIVEVDGEIHDSPRNQKEDKFREKALVERGYNIIRYDNFSVNYYRDKVLKEILENLEK